MKNLTRGRRLERTTQDDMPASFWRSASYIDTIEIMLLKRMGHDSFQRFWSARFGEPNQYDPRYSARPVTTSGGYYVFKITLHQPTAAELLALADVEEKGNCKVTRVHVALDLLAHNTCSSDDIRRHIEKRLLPTRRPRSMVRGRYDRHPKPSVINFEETTYYFRGVSSGVEVALYSDSHSKTGFGWECCHLEFRVKGLNALKASSLASLKDAYSLDHRKFWDSTLEFWRTPNAEALARRSNKAARSRTESSLGTEKNQRDAHTMIRLATHHDLGMLNAYKLFVEMHERAEKYHPRPLRMFQRVDHAWALPPSRNAIWPARSRILRQGMSGAVSAT